MSWREDPPEPTPLTLEEATEKIAKLEKRTAPLWGAIVIMFLILGVSLGVLSRNGPKPVTVHHPNATDSLRTEVTALQDSLNALRARGVPAALRQISDDYAEQTKLIEEVNVRNNQLEDRFNRHELSSK